MRGWRSYFGFCETPVVLQYLTRWVRLRLRAALWRQWKTPRRRRAALIGLGVLPRLASNTAVVVTAPGISPGLKPSLSGFLMRTSNRSDFRHCLRSADVTNRTTVYGPVRTVVWQGSAGDRRPYADQTAFREVAEAAQCPNRSGSRRGTAHQKRIAPGKPVSRFRRRAAEGPTRLLAEGQDVKGTA